MMKLILLVSSLLMSISVVSGQCYPDRHSTSWFDGWVSCEAFPSPNPQRGTSHWIMYDFGQNYTLGKSHVWNTNDPANLDRGLQNVVIDYSMDGSQWTEAGSYIFDQAIGSSIYQGFDGPDLGGIEARYLLITAIDNYGGACFGLSEVKFEAEDLAATDVNDVDKSDACFTIQTYPNPFVSKSRLIVQSQCEKEINYRISDLLGRTISQGIIGQASGFHSINIDGKTLPAGNYIIYVNQGGQSAQQHLLKIE